MIRETFYKDRPAIEISCEHFSALFLPLDGAKLVSLKDNGGNEFLAQREGENYRTLGLDTSYVEAECSAFDDMFPAVDPCVINGMDYMDHGEVARRPHLTEIKDNTVHFVCDLKKLNVTFKKSVYIENASLCINYKIENRNAFDFPYLWAGHIMFKGADGAFATSGFSHDSQKVIMFGNPQHEELNKLPPIGTKEYKFYYTKALSPMKCGIVYPESKKSIDLEFDNEVVKYLGIWANPGDLNGMYNIALEPCTALYDNPVNAEKANVASYIKASDSIEFTLKITQNEV